MRSLSRGMEDVAVIEMAHKWLSNLGDEDQSVWRIFIYFYFIFPKSNIFISK